MAPLTMAPLTLDGSASTQPAAAAVGAAPPQTGLQAVRPLHVFNQVAPGGAIVATLNDAAQGDCQERFRALEEALKADLMQADDVLVKVLVAKRSAVIERPDGTRCTIDLLRHVHPAAGRSTVKEKFGAVEALVRGYFPAPQKNGQEYALGNRGNAAPTARPAFAPYSQFPIAGGVEAQMEAHLTDTGKEGWRVLPIAFNGWSPSLQMPRPNVPWEEQYRQRTAVLRAGAATAAYVEMFTDGLDEEIERVQRAMDTAQGAAKRPKREELDRLFAMKRELTAVSYLSILSAERAVHKREATQYQELQERARKATAISYGMLKPEEHGGALARSFAVDAGMLVASQVGDLTLASQPSVLESRLAIAEHYEAHFECPANVEGATLRLYDLYRRQIQITPGGDHREAEALFQLGDLLFDGLDQATKDNLALHHLVATDAMGRALGKVEDSLSQIEEGLKSKTLTNRGVVANLRRLVIDPAKQEAVVPPAAPAPVAPAPPPAFPGGDVP